jgi:hypothetical protein
LWANGPSFIPKDARLGEGDVEGAETGTFCELGDAQ